MTYFYIYTMRREGFIARMQEQYPDVQWFLDSGAYTYYKKWESEPGKLVPWKKYKKLYFTYIEDTWERWCRIAELDLDMIEGVTPDTLAEWRDEMAFRWPHAPITPVWHASRGREDWTNYVRDPRWRYLAIGSGVSNTGFLNHLMWEARERNKIVHGFGITQANRVLPHVAFDSVDSTSWLMGQKFGTLFVFQNNKFKLIGKDGSLGKGERKLYRAYFRKIGIDWRKIEADDVAEVRKANILAWRFLSDRLETIRKLQNRTLFGTDRKEVLNYDFVKAQPRPRDGSEVQEDSHNERRAKSRSASNGDSGDPREGGS